VNTDSRIGDAKRVLPPKQAERKKIRWDAGKRVLVRIRKSSYRYNIIRNEEIPKGRKAKAKSGQDTRCQFRCRGDGRGKIQNQPPIRGLTRDRAKKKKSQQGGRRRAIGHISTSGEKKYTQADEKTERIQVRTATPACVRISSKACFRTDEEENHAVESERNSWLRLTVHEGKRTGKRRREALHKGKGGCKQPFRLRERKTDRRLESTGPA